MSTHHHTSADTIAAFLADSGYSTIEEWAADSDYHYDAAAGEWTYSDGLWAGPVDLEEAILGAIEACGFTEEKREGWFACHDCDMTFDDTEDMNEHIDTVHNADYGA